MLIIPIGTMPEKQLPVNTLVSVLKRRLRGEKDISIRRFLINKAWQIARVDIGSKNDPDPEPFLVSC